MIVDMPNATAIVTLLAIAFYFFSAILIACAVMVIAARNPVHSVLFLILSFFNAAALFVLLGAEFLAMLLVVVYVGAVAVLFLFVVMMLDVDFGSLRAGFARYLPAGLAITGVLLVEMVVVATAVAQRGAAAHATNAASRTVRFTLQPVLRTRPLRHPMRAPLRTLSAGSRPFFPGRQ